MTTADAAAGAPRVTTWRAASIGLAVCALAVVYINFYGPWIPAPGDLVLAFPISKELADPGLYSSHDLVVSSGLRMPFHVYRAAGWLFRWNLDVDQVWHMLYQLFLLATLHATWMLAWRLSGRVEAASVCVGVIAAMSFLRGGLHWSQMPVTSLVTAQVATPFALYALVALFSRRRLPALILAAFTFNIHPYVGLLTIFSVTIVVLFNSSDVPFARRATWLAIGAALALPNAIYILASLPQNFGLSADAPSNTEFYAQFRNYAWHAFVGDHWREGYGWVALNLAGLVYFSRYLDREHRRSVLLIAAGLILIMAAYLVNLYVVRIKTVILMFLFRATYLLKPIMLATLIAGLDKWCREATAAPGGRRYERWLIGVGFTLMAFTPRILYAEAIGVVTYGLLLTMLSRRTAARAGAVLLILIGVILMTVNGILRGRDLTNPLNVESLVQFENWAVGITVACAAALAGLFAWIERDGEPAARRADRGIPAGRLANAAAAMVLVLAVRLAVTAIAQGNLAILRPNATATLVERMRFSRPHPSLRGLTEWAATQTPRGSLIAVPPVMRAFDSFRYKASRGVFATTHEVNQLAFDTRIYLEAHQRLELLGIRVTGRHAFDARGYHQLTAQKLADLHREQHIDFAIFHVPWLGAHMNPYRPAFFDGTFVAFDLKQIAEQLGGS